MGARRQALGLAARALEQRLNADTSDYAGPQSPCACGQPARYIDRRAKTFVSAPPGGPRRWLRASSVGAIRLERAYYHCPACGHGFCPRDEALGLESSSLTPGVLRMAASAAALVSFEESRGLLHELGGVEVSAKQVERVAEALGAEIAVDERQAVEKESPRRAHPLSGDGWDRGADARLGSGGACG